MRSRMTWLPALLVALTTPTGAAHMMHDDAAVTVAILMFDGVQIIDFAAPYEVFGQAHFNVYTVSVDGSPVTTAMGLSVNVDHDFAGAPPAQIILVPGGDVDEAQHDDATLQWLRERSTAADQVMSVCTGSFIVAQAGLLDGRSATTFHRAFDNFEKAFPEITVVRDQRWVDTGQVVTSAGLASGIDAALHVVAQHLGERRARSIAMHLEYDWSPEEGFVRGLMADRHLRLPAEPFEFPEGTEIRTTSQVGDAQHWEIDYHVKSSWDAQALIAHLAARAAADDALTVIDTGSPLATGWRYASAHGGQWRLLLQATPAEGGEGFQVRAQLDSVDQTEPG